MLVGNCRKEVIRRLQEVLSILGGSSFAKTHGCSERCFLLCSFLLLAALAQVHGPVPEANELRYQELPNLLLPTSEQIRSLMNQDQLSGAAADAWRRKTADKFRREMRDTRSTGTLQGRLALFERTRSKNTV